MSEGPTQPERGPTKREQIIALAAELFASGEVFPFPGLNPASYNKMKAGEAEAPGHTTPVDEIVERCKNEGMKVVLGGAPQSGNLFILPAGSTDIEMDSLYPRQLQVVPGMNDKLAKLILLIQT